MSSPIFPEISPTDGHILTPSTDLLYQRAASAVQTSGSQSISGVKTFGSSPVVPNPSTSGQATNKGSVDAAIAAAVAAALAKTYYPHEATGSPAVYAGRTTLDLAPGQHVQWQSPGVTLPAGADGPQPGDVVLRDASEGVTAG